jgi:hypothetical protein
VTRRLDGVLAAALAEVALDNVRRAYPYAAALLLGCDADAQPPRRLHPAFHTAYDWHSCVHMHWTLARLLRLCPELDRAAAMRAHLSARITPATIAGELAYFARPGSESFERPYGWGWLLALDAELRALAAVPADDGAGAWRAALAPLADACALRLLDYLPRLAWPTRTGTHSNIAFACLLALDWAQAARQHALRERIAASARRWFGGDRRYPAGYEPSGEDFLSAGLVEAVLMQRVLDERDYAEWWAAFEPEPEALATWLAPVTVGDATDARLVHLHGLNLSRAWCWRRLAPVLPQALREPVARAIDAHLDASLPAATGGDYVATHWLASFALLALTG